MFLMVASMQAQVIFETDFDGPNNTTPSGFTLQAGTSINYLYLSNNEYRGVSGGIGLLSVYTDEGASSLSNYSLDVVYRVGGLTNGAYAGVVFGYKDGANYYQARMCAISSTENQWKLQVYKTVAGAATLLGESDAFAYTNATTWSLHVTMADGNISATIFSDATMSSEVASLMNISDSTFTSGTAGVRASVPNAGAVVYESFTLTSIPEPASTSALLGAIAGLCLLLVRRRARR
jgi:hypothetical protein